MTEPLIFQYKNYRGEVTTRIVTPISVRFGLTEWHPEPQWLLLAFDHEKQAEREFAMKDMRP
jgi:predicted DNA-binding transcriptional regulator YafY